MKHRIITIAIFALIAVLLVVAPVFAYVYRATYTVTSENTTDFGMIGVQTDNAVNNQWMADNGFMNSTANDTRIETLGGLIKPHMVTDNATFTAIPVPANSQTNLYFTTGNSERDFDIIPGYGGYVIVADNTTIELGDNFTVEQTGWWDTAYSVNKTAVYKEDAFQIYISATGNITAGITATLDLQVGASTDDCYRFLGGATAFSLVSPDQPAGGGDPTDMFGGGMRFLSVTIPQGATITTANLTFTSTANMAVNTVRTRISAEDIDDAPTFADNATAFDARWANSTANVSWDNIGAWVDETEYTSGDFAAVIQEIVDRPGWASGNDIVIFWEDFEDRSSAAANARRDAYSWDGSAAKAPVLHIEYLLAVTASGSTSGEYRITASANTTHFWIEQDGVTQDTEVLGGVSTPNNSANWTFYNGAMPYSVNTTIEVDGVLELWFQPNDIISGATLPDRQGGDNPGTFIWGSNPNGVSVTMGGLVSVAQPSPGLVIDDPTPDIMPGVEVTDWYIEPDVTGALLTNPMRPFVIIMSDTTTLTELQAWRLLGTALLLSLIVATAKAVRGHQGITAIAAGAGILGLVVLTIYPMWALVVGSVMFIGGLIAERSPSL